MSDSQICYFSGKSTFIIILNFKHLYSYFSCSYIFKVISKFTFFINSKNLLNSSADKYSVYQLWGWTRLYYFIVNKFPQNKNCAMNPISLHNQVPHNWKQFYILYFLSLRLAEVKILFFCFYFPYYMTPLRNLFFIFQYFLCRLELHFMTHTVA